MKIINCGRGIHAREVPGIEKLQQLPESWSGYTNLDLALPGKGVREIDLVIVTDDRLVLVDLKDWIGPISSRDGNWFNGKRDCGRSPVRKLAENVRELLPLLRKFVSDQERLEQLGGKLSIPKLDCAVVLTLSSNKDDIADSETSQVFPIDFFMRMLRNRAERETILGKPFSTQDLTNDAWTARFRRFFNAGTGIFQPGIKRYGGFTALQAAPSFTHAKAIFHEYDAQEEGVATSFGLLRKWDFTRAESRFQTEAARAEIAGREKVVIGWLCDRSQACDALLLRPRVDDAERGVAYWEVFEKRRRLKRLRDFLATDAAATTRTARIELARQVLTCLRPIHELGAAHLDLGTHSIWLEQPSTVKISHLMAASFPEVLTLGSHRYQFLSSSSVPEDVLGIVSDAIRKDVFLAGCMVHALVLGEVPAGDPPEWNASLAAASDLPQLHSWFAKALDLDPTKRFSGAGEMLDAFNQASSRDDTTREAIEGLERFRTLGSQRQVFRAYPETSLVQDDDRITIWRSDSVAGPLLVKLWKAEAIGDLAKERLRILAFLQKAQDLSDSPIPGISRIRAVHWTGDAIAVVEDFLDGVTLEASRQNGYVEFEKGSLEFLKKLSEVVSSSHERGISHGDLKPANIMLVSHVGDAVEPLLIDVLDFSPTGDGVRMTTAYAPATGTSMERDRFAVSKIAEELVRGTQITPSTRGVLEDAIEKCRSGPPANATLLPLLQAIDEIETVQSTDSAVAQIDISIKHAALGTFLSDERVYWVSRAADTLSIRGATEKIELRFNEAGAVAFVRRSRVTQSQIQARRRHEFASFAGEIVVSANHYTGVSPLLAHLDLLGIGMRTSDAEVTNLPDVTAPQSEESREHLYDQISEDIASSTRSSPVVDSHQLWKRMVELEATLVPEAVARGESSFRKIQRRHVVSVQMVIGEVDFTRGDTVIVERQDAKGRWAKIGHLDIEKSNVDYVAIDAWFDSSSSAALVADGNRLRFQSRFENTSRSRRTEATTRILANAAAAPDLLSVFQPAAKFIPVEKPLSVDAEELRARYDLNDVQIEAFRTLLGHRPVGLLQGPPGTGKTRFIAALIHYVLTHGLAKNVLLASQAHEAVNHATEIVLDLFGDDRDSLSLIRVGHEGSVSDSLLPWHVAKVERAYKDRFNATVKERLTIVARHLGVSDALVESIVRFEMTIRPLLTQMAAQAPHSEEARINTLKSTAQQLLPQIEVDFATLDVETIEQVVSELFYRGLAGGDAARVERFQHICRLARDIISSVSTWHRSFETFLAGTRQVVAGTCVGLGRTSLGLTRTMFDLVIVDEAARCTPSELAVPMQAGKWVVLVGDHAQLEPQHPPQLVTTLGRELHLPFREVAKSDFERVFEGDYGRAAGATLTAQYRMLPPIGRLVSEVFYRGALSHERTKGIIDDQAMPEHLDLPLLWIQTDALGEKAHQRPDPLRRGSLVNTTEVDVIIALMRRWSDHEPFKQWLLSRPADFQTIGVICGYAAQRDMLWKRLQTENLADVLRRTIKIETVDSYQGKQNAIVIVSLVRNNDDGPIEDGKVTIKPGFLARPNRINVAVSRAQDRLVLVGSMGRWRSDSPLSQLVLAFEREMEAGHGRVSDAMDILKPKIPKAARRSQKATPGRGGIRQ